MPDELTIYSPYKKIYDFFGMSSLDIVPAKLRDYLLCFPSQECPNPILTNENPRVRLVKYLYYDEPDPLSLPMPTVEQRKSIIYDPYNPTNPTEKRYRVFTQMAVNQAELEGSTILRIVMGKTIPYTPFSATIGVEFVILSNYTLESNTRTTALSRTYSIELAILEALNGVNIDGVGAFMFSRGVHPDCGSRMIYDEKMNVGRALTMAFEGKGGSPVGPSEQ